MEAFSYFAFILVFIFGSSIGSFLNVIIDRLPKKKTTLSGRSHCDSCKRKLTPLELIPVFSYLFLRGRCRTCHSRIPVRVFFVELLTAMLFVSLYSYFLWYEMPLAIVVYIFLVSSLFIPIIFIDLEYGIIPDELLIILTIVVASFVFLSPWSTIISHVLSGLVAFLLFLSLFFITKGKGMGLGDVKLSFVLGLFLGFPKVIAGFYVAFLGGAIISLVLVFLGKKHFRKGTVPFGPFLIVASFLSYFFGEQMLQLFFKFL